MNRWLCDSCNQWYKNKIKQTECDSCFYDKTIRHKHLGNNNEWCYCACQGLRI